MDPLAIPADPRPLGRSGLACRPLAWNMRPGERTRAKDLGEALAAARHAGVGLVTFSDHPSPGSRAPAGQASALLGDLFRTDPAARGDFLLALGGGIGPGPSYDATGPALAAEVDRALARLGLPAIDLFILLRPDRMTPAAEVAAALDKLVTSGRVRAVGVANHRPAEIRALLAHLETPLAAMQAPLSLLAPGALAQDLPDLAQELGIPLLASAPLAEGQLGDRPGMAGSVTARAMLRALDAIAGRDGLGRAAVAGAFVALHGCRAIPLFGTQDPKEIAELAGLFRVALTRADWYRLLEAGLGHTLPTTDAYR